jgi:site-specific recombinase XerD
MCHVFYTYTANILIMSNAPTIKTRTFHSFKPGYIDSIVVNSKMSPADVEIMSEFISEKKATASIGVSRERRIYQHLRVLREFSPVDFNKITFKILTRILPAIKDCKNEEGNPRFAQNTYRDVVAVTKMFLHWLIDEKHIDITESQLKKIKLPQADEHTIKPDDLLSEESRDAMIRACQNSRDRAIISLLFEAGLRPVEIGRLTHKDVEFTHNSMNVYVREKTARQRKIPAPLSKQYIKAWLNDCPYEPSPDAVVFCSLTPTILADGSRQWLPLKGDAMRIQLKHLAQVAGVKNYIKPYQFRHTMISDCINGGLPERMVTQMSHGGDTRMMKIYYHVSDDEIENRVLARHGLVSDNHTKKDPTSLKCADCGTRNPPTLKFCGNCGGPLTEEAQSQIETTRASVQTYGEGMPEERIQAMIDKAVRAALAGKK